MASDYERCPTCSEWAWTKRHRCKPVWLVFTEDRHEDWDEADRVYATDAQEAAEKWAEQDDCDSAEYSIVAGTDAAVQVRRLDEPDTDPVWWVVSGESVPQYHGNEATQVKCSRCQTRGDLDPKLIGQLHDACVSAGFQWARWEVA
jgi:hypothetical protein